MVDGTGLVAPPFFGVVSTGTHNEVPVEAEAVKAVVYVTADDPVAAFDAWLEQMRGLQVDEITTMSGGLTRSASGYQLDDEFRSVGDSVGLQLVEGEPNRCWSSGLAVSPSAAM